MGSLCALAPPIWLKIILGISYLLQIILLLFFPVPSPVSAGRLPVKGGKKGTPATYLRMMMASNWMIVPSFIGASLPVPMLIFPSWQSLIWQVPFSPYRHIFSVILLLSADFLVLLAVVQLRSQTGFNQQGESLQLIENGVFSYLRHPVATGLSVFYLALLVSFPTLFTALGIVCYFIHQHRKLQEEEKLLEKRFGDQYRNYTTKLKRLLQHKQR